MIPSKFDYERANTIDEAIKYLVEYGDEAKLLAGGHSLLPAMKLRLNSPVKLLDIHRIPELKYIKEEDDTICIGAATTHYEIESSELIKGKISMLSQIAGSIGDVQVRNMGTIGGSLAHADPAADWPAGMLATDAVLVLKGPDGLRTIDAHDFFLGLYTTSLAENEIITEIRIPIPHGNTGTAYTKCMQPASRFALVGCAAIISKNNGLCDNVKLAFTGVSANAFRDAAVEEALTGHAPDVDNITIAAEKAALDADVLSDHFASEDYRRHLAKVYAKRALMEAADNL